MGNVRNFHKVGALFLVVALGLFGCGKKDTSPVAPEVNETPFMPSATGGISFQISHYGGDPFTLSPSALVDHTDPKARIWVEFESQMKPDTIGISLKKSDGTVVPVDFHWQVGPTTALILTPISDLNYNSTYVFEIKAAQVRDVAGNMLDMDGDGKGGESPDDDLYARFTTHREGDEFQDLDHDGIYDNLQDLNGDHIFNDGQIGEPFTDQPPYNHHYDNGEPYIDLNGNGFYDAGERYFDNNGNGRFDRDGEPFQDIVNHNGICDLGEFFQDLDHDSTWDPAEPYTDVNGDGRYNYTELRYDADGDEVYDPEDGDTYSDTETPNGRCDYAEPFTNLNHDSTTIRGHRDSTGTLIKVPHWDDAEPVYPGYDYDGDDEYDPAVTIGLGGDPWDPFSAPFELVRIPTNPDTVRVRFIGYSEPFTDTNHNLIWNWPEGDYWVDAISNGVYDASGESLTVDLDNDGNYDQPQPGTPVPPTLDDMHPYVKRFPYYLIGNQEVSTIWTDVSIAVDLADQTYDPYGEIVTQPVDENTVDTSTVILREADSKTSVRGTVSYDNVETSPTLFRVTFDPAEDLKPGTDYELTLKAQEITDAAGNKLSNTQDIVYKFTTGDRNSDGSVVAEDIVRPDVDHFSNNYDGTFSVYFTEEIDKQTISNATIVLTSKGKRAIGTLSLGAWNTPTSPSGIGTTVTFKPLDNRISSGSVVVTADIKDLAGNRKGHDNQWYW